MTYGSRTHTGTSTGPATLHLTQSHGRRASKTSNGNGEFNGNGHHTASSDEDEHSHYSNSVQTNGNKRRRLSPECSACSKSLARPWACLTCPFVGCHMPMSITASGQVDAQKVDCGRDHWTGGKCAFGETLSLYLFPSHTQLRSPSCKL